MAAPTDGSNVGIAFALVIGASLATGVGASVVFIPNLVKLADHRILASSLGFSAGIMGYVSFVEIFPKSRLSFEQAGFSINESFNLASVCFFCGVMVMILLNILVHKIVDHKHPHKCNSERSDSQNVDIEDVPEQSSHREHREKSKSTDTLADTIDLSLDDDWGHMCIPGTSDELEFLQYIASNITKEVVAPEEKEKQSGGDPENSLGQQESHIQDSSQSDKENSSLSDRYHNRKLLQMGLLTAIAIALHNFPEGLATFVTVLDNPRVGAVLAIAIAIHNVPEGLCVALPVYYATGSRRKAFLWGTLSGMTEVVAAFFGWAVLSNSYSQSLFAALFGLVAGMMVTISIRELLPTAHRHDPHDKFVTASFIVGMVVIGFSLVLFRL